jgi:hypothetical protein
MKKIFKVLKKLAIVLFVVLIIVTVGLIIQESDEENEEPKDDTKPLNAEEETEIKKKRLEQIEEKIKNIELRKIEIIRNEKSLLFYVRSIIGFILITVNGLYFYRFNTPFSLGDQLNINYALLLSYTFIAYVSYGTPAKFANALKSKIIFVLKRKHISLIEELEPLKVERELLKKEIEDLTLR